MQEREILFRAKSREDDEWIVSGSIKQSIYFIPCLWVQGRYYDRWELIHPNTLGRYTGLVDKNGVKIFEGDIIKHHFGEDYGVVKFGEYSQPSDNEFTRHIGFYVDWVTGESKDVLRKDLGYWVDIDSCDIVAGNIHDNPELIKE